jgi:hypothetical protein
MTKLVDDFVTQIEHAILVADTNSATWRGDLRDVVFHFVEGHATALQSQVAALTAERDTLAGIVQGWHYLAVGPDEMGDYHTHKQLVKLSEPYASPSLRALASQVKP